MSGEKARLQLYFAAFASAFLIYLVMSGPGRGLGFSVAAGLGLAGIAWIVWGLLGTACSLAGLVPIVAGISALAMLVPLAGQQGNIGQTMVWPQMLVALFASRVLSQATRLENARPGSSTLQQAQSFPAALALGAFLTLAFQGMLPPRIDTSDPALKVLAAALHGSTLLHTAIIYLFFAIAAAILDGFGQYWRQRMALAAGGMADSGSAKPGLQLASRRFLRSLIPLLPLLGFLGTVVGLTTALNDLPRGLAAGGAPDISASLSGLAIKFETTLLGLLGSMIAIAALNILEKKEAELIVAFQSAAETAGRNRETAE